ncbi:MAG: hypothetical protein WD795_15875 [Woeseia sp.]
MRVILTVLAILLTIPVTQARDQFSDPLRRAQRGANAQDTLLAALGEATLACLGTVSTTAYRVNSARVLERSFDACTTRDTRALEQIDRLLGVQHSREARQDRLSERYAQVWKKAARVFPSRAIEECPDWELLHVIDEPTLERVASFASKEGAAKIGKEYRWYKVSSEQCGSNGFCAVFQAMLCGAGFSNQFIVWTDPFSSSVVVDPAWWLTTYEYGSDRDPENPFKAPGYYHPMSYYGDPPGSMYAAIQREGEACSRWSETAQKHYTDRTLQALDCGGGWECACYCY